MCGGSGKWLACTICMFSLTDEYKRTNTYDKHVKIKKFTRCTEHDWPPYQIFKSGIASWRSNIDWIQLDGKHEPHLSFLFFSFLFYSTSVLDHCIASIYQLQHLPKIGMQMTTTDSTWAAAGTNIYCEFAVPRQFYFTTDQLSQIIHQGERSQTWSIACALLIQESQAFPSKSSLAL